jgi:LL-diaminopimelate aminotransferase
MMEGKMSDFVQNLIAERLGGNMFGKDTKIYKFEKIKRAKRAALEANPGKELIDMGVGEPDDMANIAIVNVLKEEAMKKENRFYSDNGIQEFKDVAAEYMKKRFGVDINPQTEINHAIGSKPALAMIPFCLINPGDYALMTIPGYPVTGTITKYLGGQVYNLPLTKENNFLPDLDSIPEDIRKKAKILYLNYPNNPTGALADKKFFEKVVKFAKENDIAVVHDAAYIELTYGEEQPSFLSVEGAKEVGIEIHSLSKSFNMTGWRMAFVCGNETLVKAFATVKDNNDSGQFIPIQKAAAYALSHPELINEIRDKYKRRLVKLAKVLRDNGFYVNEPKGTFYLYFEIPKGTKSGRKFENAEQFCDYLIREKLISSVPWDDAGHFLRFTVTFEAKDLADEERVIGEIARRLSEEEFIF